MAGKMHSSSVISNGTMHMPIVGLGTWQSTPEELDRALNAAIDTGYRYIDTAYIYGNESAIGETLKGMFASGKVKREELFIVTKLPFIGNRAEDVEEFMTKSLAALQLDYVDLYLIHLPVGVQRRGEELLPRDENGHVLLDLKTDLEAIWKAMEDQCNGGKAKNIGLSNFNLKQIHRILKICRIMPANLQVELHAYLQQKELVQFCKDNGIVVCAYSPMGSPGIKNVAAMLATEMPVAVMEDPVILDIAKKHNKSPSQILLRYLIEYGVAVIPKSTNPDRIKQNYDVFSFELSKEEFDKISSLDRGEEGRIFGGCRKNSFLHWFRDHPEYPFLK